MLAAISLGLSFVSEVGGDIVKEAGREWAMKLYQHLGAKEFPNLNTLLTSEKKSAADFTAKFQGVMEEAAKEPENSVNRKLLEKKEEGQRLLDRGKKLHTAIQDQVKRQTSLKTLKDIADGFLVEKFQGKLTTLAEERREFLNSFCLAAGYLSSSDPPGKEGKGTETSRGEDKENSDPAPLGALLKASTELQHNDTASQGDTFFTCPSFSPRLPSPEHPPLHSRVPCHSADADEERDGRATGTKRTLVAEEGQQDEDHPSQRHYSRLDTTATAATLATNAVAEHFADEEGGGGGQSTHLIALPNTRPVKRLRSQSAPSLFRSRAPTGTAVTLGELTRASTVIQQEDPQPAPSSPSTSLSVRLTPFCCPHFLEGQVEEKKKKEVCDECGGPFSQLTSAEASGVWEEIVSNIRDCLERTGGGGEGKGEEVEREWRINRNLLPHARLEDAAGRLFGGHVISAISRDHVHARPLRAVEVERGEDIEGTQTLSLNQTLSLGEEYEGDAEEEAGRGVALVRVSGRKPFFVCSKGATAYGDGETAAPTTTPLWTLQQKGSQVDLHEGDRIGFCCPVRERDPSMPLQNKPAAGADGRRYPQPFFGFTVERTG
uniref:Uncharacterized protein n=1 Tax=Chromera velia CCMP2878 TaxID=1169474 RepID=A0A0G4FWV0_9ALVE|eukprot:Cvel_19079.t1-p1 / transcript=Cvel_19079.t1 / gene=Cvel_19079 / organism=Chromera_velia_CCMP2878 / gene_product=hypothetical protein / transcript_product=hypothetical protein / location=Cvel_scaffold1619:17586-21126(-) / protein_length=603 / sequence_SO=supercontig / SO=protein_coding / is_pseudo=false